jgi:hypothetical protein
MSVRRREGADGKPRCGSVVVFQGSDLRVTHRLGRGWGTRMDTDAGGAGARMDTDEEKKSVRVHPWIFVCIRVPESFFLMNGVPLP